MVLFGLRPRRDRMGRRDKKNVTSQASLHNDTIETRRVAFKTPATAVLLLRAPEEDILIKACQAIYEFAEEGDLSKVYLMEHGALEPLSQLITHSNNKIRRNALIGLGVMATNGTARTALQNMDVIPSIIDKLSLDDIIVHEFGTLCLSCLSTESCCKVQIIDNNGLPVLINLLSSSDPDVQKNSLDTIYNLVQDTQICPAVIDLDGLRQLLTLLKSVFNSIQQLALKTLQTIAISKESQSAFREQRVFDELIEILNNKDLIDLHMETLMVFSNCMSDLDSFRVIQNGGGLSTLMDLLLTPKVSESQAALLKNSNIEIQAVAVKCIANAAQNSDLHPFLHEQKIEKVLVDVLSGGSDNVKAYGCQAFAALSSFSPSKHLFRDLGGIPVVVRLLKSKIPEIIEYATQGLAKLTSGVQLNTMAVFYARGPEILVQRLQDTCPKVLANSITILGRMAGQEAIRCKVVSEGLMRALVEPLKSADIQVLISALLCICELAFEEDARAKLRGADGLEPLVSLLRSSHMEVLRCTCMAISVCAKDEPTALEMCKFGALEILQDITQSINRRSKFTEFALISLLKYNLSLKYGLLGYLATTDLITNGLYDAGKVGFCQKLLTLEELCKEPINQRRPVIVVNAIEMSDDGQQKDEAQSECSQERNRILMDDISLPLLVKEVKESIEPLIEEQEQYIALARFVSEIMGGAIEKEELDTFAWLQHLDELRCKLQRNVIPIGMISKGFLCHRALLFKYLSDSIGLRCTLVRGDYNRAWNEVLLHKGEPCSNENFSQPCCYIVDLMHQPGTLLEADSSAALEYESL
ncbi:armadillo repeat-containing protein 3-like isoform X2 [Syngnathoides biaculeatus]|uniref:armadillo repeat-containing protein 3-like isoform X2 n=1 Tax=Syngnathoides biaculeatus TaxID=300417 RepID=UPI002ADDD3AC|nr:armadillo repeat-containing protein 3-like isoform X2 [Syngnathoides biaculeatus]